MTLPFHPQPKRGLPASKQPAIAGFNCNGCGHRKPVAGCGYCTRKLKRRHPKTCRQCRRSFWPPSIRGRIVSFCSARCYADYRAARAFAEFTCAECGAVFRRRVVRTRPRPRAFCSRVCMARHLTGERHPTWRGGSDPNRGHGWRKLAEVIRERDRHCCRWCGRTQAENGQKLSVDHVRPWREFDADEKHEANDQQNLVSLCRRCHSKKSRLERQWLQGDKLALDAYRRAVSISPAG
jgi:5-methylcytosine-specific restriction endonuclease McrA